MITPVMGNLTRVVEDRFLARKRFATVLAEIEVIFELVPPLIKLESSYVFFCLNALFNFSQF